jgi:hypothetical protein
MTQEKKTLSSLVLCVILQAYRGSKRGFNKDNKLTERTNREIATEIGRLMPDKHNDPLFDLGKPHVEPVPSTLPFTSKVGKWSEIVRFPG